MEIIFHFEYCWHYEVLNETSDGISAGGGCGSSTVGAPDSDFSFTTWSLWLHVARGRKSFLHHWIIAWALRDAEVVWPGLFFLDHSDKIPSDQLFLKCSRATIIKLPKSFKSSLLLVLLLCLNSSKLSSQHLQLWASATWLADYPFVLTSSWTCEWLNI